MPTAPSLDQRQFAARAALPERASEALDMMAAGVDLATVRDITAAGDVLDMMAAGVNMSTIGTLHDAGVTAPVASEFATAGASLDDAARALDNGVGLDALRAAVQQGGNGALSAGEVAEVLAQGAAHNSGLQAAIERSEAAETSGGAMSAAVVRDLAQESGGGAEGLKEVILDVAASGTAAQLAQGLGVESERTASLGELRNELLAQASTAAGLDDQGASPEHPDTASRLQDLEGLAQKLEDAGFSASAAELRALDAAAGASDRLNEVIQGDPGPDEALCKQAAEHLTAIAYQVAVEQDASAAADLGIDGKELPSMPPSAGSLAEAEQLLEAYQAGLAYAEAAGNQLQDIDLDFTAPENAGALDPTIQEIDLDFTALESTGGIASDLQDIDLDFTTAGPVSVEAEAAEPQM